MAEDAIEANGVKPFEKFVEDNFPYLAYTQHDALSNVELAMTLAQLNRHGASFLVAGPCSTLYFFI